MSSTKFTEWNPLGATFDFEESDKGSDEIYIEETIKVKTIRFENEAIKEYSLFPATFGNKYEHYASSKPQRIWTQ